MSRRILASALISLIAGANACAPAGPAPGAVDDPNFEATGGDGDASATSGDSAPDLDDIEVLDPELLPDGVPAASRVLRLSYADYDRSVSDLLFTEVTPSELFPAEQPNLGPYESSGSRAANERLVQELALAAEFLAEETANDAPRLAQIVGCSSEEASCRDSFIARFGRRAFRRPLTQEETARYVALFEMGSDVIASGDGFRDGVQLVIEGMLQSSKFLYRVEQGSGQLDEAGVLLTGFEIATRLSYLFWGSIPDEALLDAAGSGELDTPEGISIHTERLVDDPRLEGRVLDFHHRWLDVEGLAAASKDPQIFPQFDENLLDSMRAEVDAFVSEVTLNRDGAIVELLNTPLGAVDAPLAQLYGISGSFGDSPTLVDFPPESGRKGLLTQAAFLTGHSSAATRTSPILRGVFLLKRMLCQDVQPPPPGAEAAEPDTAPESELLTTRQFFEWKTSMPVCANCHKRINPLGFAFEGFDAIGAARSTENGAAVATNGDLMLDGRLLAFNDASELIDQLAMLPSTRSCYATHWLKYAQGREPTTEDARTLGRITQNLDTAPYGVRGVLREITSSTAFFHLPPKTN